MVYMTPQHGLKILNLVSDVWVACDALNERGRVQQDVISSEFQGQNSQKKGECDNP